MKIRALRLKSFCKFAGAFEISGIVDGLNVLAGDNETGKSTVFRALEAVFQTSYRATGKPLDDMRPYGGGDPYVEVDFDAADGSWRMAKQFGRGKAAVLSDLKSGREVARAAEAEEQFAKLVRLTGEGVGRLGLVWVSQQRALRAPDPDIDPATGKAKARGETNALVEAVGREVETAAGGEASSAIIARVTEALGQLITAKTEVPVKNGPLDLALKTRAGAQAKLQTAQRFAAAAEQRLTRIGELTDDLKVRNAPEKREELESKFATLQARMAQEAHARAARDIAQEALKALRLETDAARKQHNDLQKLMSEAACLDKDGQEAKLKRQELDARIVDLSRSVEKRNAELGRLDAAIEAMRSELSTHDQLASRKSAEARIKELRATNETAGRLEIDIHNLIDALASDPATPEHVRQLDVLCNEIALIDAELNAAAAHVEFALSDDGAGKVTVDGAAVPPKGRLAVAGRLDIAIEGIGVIHVQAADATRLREKAQRRDEVRATLAALLLAMCSTDANAARAKAAVREHLADELKEKRARLSGLVPQGRATLENEIDLLLAHIGPDHGASAVHKPRAEIVSLLEAALTQRKGIEQQRAEADNNLNACERSLAALAGSEAARVARATEISVAMPPELERAVELARIAGHANQKTSAVESAQSRFAALDAAILSIEQFSGLSIDLDAAERAQKQQATDVQRLNLDLVRLKGEQAGTDEDGKAGDVAGAEGELARAESEVARLEAEVAALRLLSRTLNAAEEKTRAQYFEPVTRRLAPYLSRVIPEAQPSFKDGFSLEGLIRAGQREEFLSLSDGTREQLSVLVRMAFARLIADGGEAAPLVLDDPLVYSDDARLNSLCRVLEDASASHQIILLTCRATAFKDLAGHRLAITSWKPAN